MKIKVKTPETILESVNKKKWKVSPLNPQGGKYLTK